MRSSDRGRTWEPPVALEPSVGPEASYAVVLKVPGGRMYAFYNHNTDNVRQVKADSPPFADGFCRRVDSLGCRRDKDISQTTLDHEGHAVLDVRLSAGGVRSEELQAGF